MNLVGKIFVGVIAFMSVVCLTVSAMSFASHHNYKQRNEELKGELDKVKAQVDSLNGQKADLQVKIASEAQTYMSVLEALKTKVEDLEKSNAQLVSENKDLSAERQSQINIIESNNEVIADIRAEIDAATKNLADATQVRGEMLQQLAQAVEQVHESASQYGDLNEKTTELQNALADAKAILAKNGMSSDLADYADAPQYPVQGTILDVSQGYDGMLMISIGSDDGLSENNRLDVRRGDSYLGKIEVVSTEPNRAVCKILPEYRKGVMQEGDNVYASKVN